MNGKRRCGSWAGTRSRLSKNMVRSSSPTTSMDERHQQLQTALADRYRIERELDAGGKTTVYLAEDLKHQRRVALKVFSPELAASAGTKAAPPHFI